MDGYTYWDESAYYQFRQQDVERCIEDPANELEALCRDFAGRACDSEEILQSLAIPDHAWDLVSDSWKRSDPALTGRFDFAWDGAGPAKLLEYNADTPGALFETAIFQKVWMDDCISSASIPTSAVQFNALQDALMRQLALTCGGAVPLHLACLAEQIEDQSIVDVVADCARLAGCTIRKLTMDQIGLSDAGRFVDPDDQPIAQMYKAYPWEWMFSDEFGTLPAVGKVRWLEPAWKALLSNKAMLVHLWGMEKGHPNLLPAYFETDPRKLELGKSFVKKPIFSREGENILIVREGQVLERTEGTYGHEGYIRQGLAHIPDFDGNFPVIGCWTVSDKACAIGVREDRSWITTDNSRFIPHAVIAKIDTCSTFDGGLMKVLVFAFIAAVVAVMAWLWFQPECAGGTVVADEKACVRTAGFDKEFCSKAFANSKEIARKSGALYPTDTECNMAWPKCMDSGPTGEAVPVPSGWCMVRSPTGAVARMKPVYNNYRQ